MTFICCFLLSHPFHYYCYCFVLITKFPRFFSFVYTAYNKLRFGEKMGRFKVVFCISNKVFHILNCTFLILVYAAQSVILNTYIVNYNKTWSSYFWYLGDLILVCLFITASIKAYLYLLKKKLEKESKVRKPDNPKVCNSSTIMPKLTIIF